MWGKEKEGEETNEDAEGLEGKGRDSVVESVKGREGGRSGDAEGKGGHPIQGKDEGVEIIVIVVKTAIEGEEPEIVCQDDGEKESVEQMTELRGVFRPKREQRPEDGKNG